MSDQGKNGEFYAKDNVIWKSPIYRRNEAGNGDSIEVGFPVCTASTYVDPEALVGVFTEHAAQQAKSWRCFHCDEVFTDEHCAKMHFGMDPCSDPACKIKMGAERSLVTALRRAESELADAWAAIHNESTEAAKAYRALQSRHSEQLRAAQELGYELGLSDARDEFAASASHNGGEHE